MYGQEAYFTELACGGATVRRKKGSKTGVLGERVNDVTGAVTGKPEADQ